MKEIRLEYMTWNEIEEAMGNGYDTVVIFAGSIEQHGPHLPLATDTILSYALGERVARRLGKALLAPVIRPGLSEHHMKFKGSITLSKETFKSTVRDILHSLARHGFRRLVVAWAHGGNVPALVEVLPEVAKELPEVEILAHTDSIAFFKAWIPLAEEKGIDLEHLGVHSGEGETSCMLAYAPELVRWEKAATGFLGDLVNPEGAHGKLLAEGLDKITSNGILGDALLADAQRGEQYLESLAEHIVGALNPVLP